MASNYPGSLDNFSTSHADGVNETIHASTVNDLADAVNKIESTLGSNPVLTSNFSAVRKITSSATAASTDYQILGDATSAGVTVTLPAASSSSGQRILIRKIDSSTHNVTVSPAGTDTIDGVTGNVVLRLQDELLELVSDGTAWQRVNALYGNKKTYYVDATYGNDAFTGHFPWAAKKTIGAAIGGYRTVYVAEGVYTETVDIGNCLGLRLLGTGPIIDSFSAGVIVVAPSSSASALIASGAATGCEVAYMGFMGERTGGSGTYTGTVVDASNMTIGCHIHDIQVTGIGADFTAAKTKIGSGAHGGIGILFGASEQAEWDNINISNCNIAMKFSAPGSTGQSPGTLSKMHLSNFHLGACFIIHQEIAGSWGDNIFENFKTQNVFGLTYAVAQLNSNGSNPADGDTVTVRNQTYRFKNTMALANDVKIGATIDATLLSLVHAVNGTGTVGTDYFTGTAQPTGVRAGWMNLVDYGASGGNGYTNDAVDTTHHACTFQVQDVLGPSGNVYTFTVTSTNLTDYFGKGTFDRAAWAIEIQEPNQWISVDAMENIALPIGNAILVNSSGSYLHDFVMAPQTQMSITGNVNYFVMPKFQNSVIVQAGAQNNIFDWPFNNTATTVPNSSRITDNGTGTVVRMAGTAAQSPVVITYGTTMTANVFAGESFVITATNGTAFTINNPSSGSGGSLFPGMKITYTIRNTSGGALGTATWGTGHKMASWTQPANGNSRSITFRYDGTNWIEIGRTASDVPN